VKHWIAIGLMALLAPAYGQEILMAEADRYRLGLGEEVRVSFRFQGKGDRFEPPEMGGDWAVLSGPNRSFQTSIVNGRMSQEQKYDYLLRPRKMGTLMLGAARIRSKGKWIESKPLRFEVSKSAAPPTDQNDPRARAARNSFMKIRTSKRTVYVGEPLVLEYILYYNDAEMPQQQEDLDIQGFYKQDLEVPENEQKGKEVIDGKSYDTYIFKRQLLVPQLSSASISGQALVMIPTYLPSKRRDIFGRRQMELIRQRVMLSAPKLEVRSLPQENRPASFNGAVGQFRFQMDLSRAEVEADGSVTLNTQLSGTGNIGLLNLPEPKFPTEFEAFDPEQKQSIRNTSGGQTGSIRSEHLLIPRYRGTYRIPAVRFSYFDTQKKDYVEIVQGPFELKVSGGQEAPAAGQLGTPLPSAGSSKQSLTLLDQDIRFIDLGNVRWRRLGDSGSVLWWALGVLPFLLVAMAQLLFSRQKQRFQNRAEIRASKAFRKVQRGIRSLDKTQKEEHSDRLHALMEDYLFEKLGIGRSEMNAERWSKLLLEKNIERATVDRLIALYTSLLGGRFAPGGTDIGARSEELLSALEELEKQWR
jgi:hypothetical protein